MNLISIFGLIGPIEAPRSAALVLAVLACSNLVWAQSVQGSHPETDPPIVHRSDGRGYTLRVMTREVVIEVVARDHHNHPVNDLTQADFEVF